MQDFTPADAEAARAFYQSISDPIARSVFDFLVDHPEERFDGAALVQQVGLEEHRAVARATFRLGAQAAALGRRRPWTEAQLGYLMPAAQAELFRRETADGRRKDDD